MKRMVLSDFCLPLIRQHFRFKFKDINRILSNHFACSSFNFKASIMVTIYFLLIAFGTEYNEWEHRHSPLGKLLHPFRNEKFPFTLCSLDAVIILGIANKIRSAAKKI